MKTFSNMSTPLMQLTSEAYDLLWDKLKKRKADLDDTISARNGRDVNTDELKQESREIEDKLNLLGPLLVELAPLIF